ncbi:glycosyltransferase family 1 protein [Halodesulfovibrio sp.]|jgi:alpha-1,3-rhamnosyl/mannosyltransferase|uniref:glycosyltransferase family 4 protein n=1 Tax=Halodesulfovibrio sp. TaxID=1912772 RepID=UPI0025DB4CF2|nr:glycosyltransferase family 1 protein [Halodesulfovibrio sp.]MCT4535235.1 glycosyltransferase family 4 protein [Halodesulfovibrio sp.]
MPLNILVNAIPLTNVHTGIARYTHMLYATMQAQYGSAINVTFFDGKNCLSTPPSGPQNISGWNALVDVFWKLPPSIACSVRNAVQIKRERAIANVIGDFDVYHETGFFPFACAAHIPTVFTVHDMSLQRHPEWHPKERVLFTETYFAKRASLADHIITVSEFTRTEFHSVFPELSDIPVTPIHLGASPDIFAQQSNIPELPDAYYLFVGSNDSRKQLDQVVAAVCAQNDLPLLVAGWNGWGKSIEHHEKIIPLGHVSDTLLAHLYSNATCLIYPSAYEGFGLPVLEAMQCGCPVITARNASLPEVGGDAVCYINGAVSPETIRHALNALRKEDRTRYKQAGFMQAKKFSWKKTAQKTYDILQQTSYNYTQQNKK